MKREQFKNDSITTLDGSIDDSQTTLDVNDASLLSADGSFRIRIDSEILQVTAVSSNTLTVVRGIEGTTPASHANGSTVSQTLTVGGIQRWAQDNDPLWGSTRPPSGIYSASGVLVASDFTGVNDGDSSLTDSYGLLIQKEAHGASDNLSLFVRSMTAPYTVTAAFQICAPCSVRGTSPQVGLCLRNSGDGKLYHFAVSMSNVLASDNAPWFWVGKYNSPTSLASALVGPCPLLLMSDRIWVRLLDDSTDLKFSLSCDGLHFIEVASEARATFSTPDQAGLSIQSYLNSDEDFTIAARVTHYSES
jgi:hypothetical protein